MIGLGHVSRCVALARGLAAAGAGIRLLVTPDEHVRRLLARASLEVTEVPWGIDPRPALRLLGDLSPDVVVVDSYAASPEFVASLRSVTRQVVAIDDLALRQLPAHVIVNGSVGAEALAYCRTPGTVFLLGPRYALVDPRYATVPDRSITEAIRRIFICLGGGQRTDLVATAVAAAEAVIENAIVDVVLGPFAGRGDGCEASARGARNRVVVHRNLFDLRGLMLAADVAISGAGMTLQELAAAGTPAVVVRMADNQTTNVEGFERAGAALVAGDSDDPGVAVALESILRRLAGDSRLRAAMSRRARGLVDGQGALRVAREIAPPVASRR